MAETTRPIACRLDALSPEERQRQQALRQDLEAAIESVREAPDGYVFTYRDDATVFRRAAEWLTLERRCCPFVDFELGWRADSRSPTLRMGGEPGVKAFIAGTFLPLS
ncbi:MAG: hypothetical protein ACRD09_12245 [Vicinamibacterales bacterium]